MGPLVILLVLATSFVVLGAGAVAASLDVPRTVDLVTAWLVLTCAQVVVIVLVVGGALPWLNPLGLCVAATIAGVAELTIAIRWHRTRVRNGIERLRAAAVDATRGLVRSPAAIALGSLVAAQYAWRAAQVLYLPKVGYDGLSYHLISPDTWIQAGRVVHTPQMIYADVYPQNQEVLTAWLGTFLHSMHLSALAHVPFLLMGTFAVAGIARGLGAGRRAAGLAGLAFLAIPVVFLPVGTDYVDVSATAAVLAALQFTLRFADDDQHSSLALLFLTGCSMGLAVGTKSANLIAVGLLLVLLLVLGAKRLQTLSWRAGSAALVLPVIALGSFWYVRTWITYANPFYPVSALGFEGTGTIDRVLIGGNKPAELTGNVISNVLHSWIADLTAHNFVSDQRLGGFGLQWIVVLLPAMVAAVVLAIRRRRRDVWLIALYACAVTLASPAAWWARFTLVLPAVALALFAWVVTVVDSGAVRRTMSAALVATTAVTMWWATQPTFIQIVDDGRLREASVAEVVDLMRDPNPGERMNPWFNYAPLTSIPSDATIAIPTSSLQPFMHPFVGDDLSRQLVHIDDPTNAIALRASMDATGARYVLVDPAGTIAAMVTSDPAHFRRVPDTSDIFGEWLVELGEFRVCPDATLTLAVEGPAATADPGAPVIADPGAPVLLTGRMTDGCADPVADVDVEIWQGNPSLPVWDGDTVAAVVRTGADGTFRAEVTPGVDANRFFAHTPVIGAMPATASSPVIIPGAAPSGEPQIGP